MSAIPEKKDLSFRRYRDGDNAPAPWQETIFQAGYSYKCPTYVQATAPCQAGCPAGEDRLAAPRPQDGDHAELLLPSIAGRPRGTGKFDELRFYAEHFDTVEVNSTFYRVPAVDAVRKWAERTPPGFEFSLKLYQKAGIYRFGSGNDAQINIGAGSFSSTSGFYKLAQEHMLAAWTAAHDTDLSVLRLQNVYGPGQSLTNSYTGIVTLFARLAREHRPLEVYEDGRIVRDRQQVQDGHGATNQQIGRHGSVDWQRRDQAILNADDDIQTAKCHIRDAEKPDQTLRVKEGRGFYGQKREERQQNSSIENPAVINARPNE